MRKMSIVVVAAVLACGLSGCGDSAKADSLAQQMVDEMNRMGDNLEKGDKAALKASFAKMSALAKESKDLKLTSDQNKAIEDKYKPKLEAAQTHMMQAMIKSRTSGKLSQEDIMELGAEMQTLGHAMQK